MNATAIATTEAASRVTRARSDTDRVSGIGGRMPIGAGGVIGETPPRDVTAPTVQRQPHGGVSRNT